MQLIKYFSNLSERFGVRLTEIKILRDLIIIIYSINLISQQINISEFTVKNHQLSKKYILIFRIQNLITPENKIIKSTNDITDEI
jgi:DNA-binding CsgD family transcriptional regulator